MEMEIETKREKIEFISDNEEEEDKYCNWMEELWTIYINNLHVGGLDLSSVNLEKALEWLKKEGYKERREQDDNTPKKTAVLCLLDIDSYMDDEGIPKLIKTFNQFEYILNYYDDSDCSFGFIGCMLCGGMFTALMDYENGIPQVETNFHIGMVVPKGNTPMGHEQLHNFIIGSLLLLARKYSENSPFYKDDLPLDIFKIIFKFSNLF
jgi:hypothetical protein